jgi:cytochrome c
MKKTLFVLASFCFLVACNSGSNSSESKKEETPAANDLSSNPVYQKGLDLVGKSDCLTCHAVADKINGPAYRDVANKYASAGDTIIPHLAKKIINGGNGVWGQVPMTPHPTMSEEDAEALVKYVLLLKN